MTREPASRIKMVSAVTKALGEGRIHAVVSTEAKDRDGDIIRQAFWDLKDFRAHPVLITSHDYYSLRSQIGEWESMKVEGKQLEGVAHYYVGEGNPEADWGYNLASKGKAAYSVGFIPDFDKANELGDSGGWFQNYEFKGQKLLEVSHVTIPSNPEALQSAKTKGLHPALNDVVAHFLQVGTVPDVSSVTTASHSGTDDFWFAHDASSITKSAHGEHDHEHDEDGKHDHDEEGKLLALEAAFRAMGIDFKTLRAKLITIELSTKFRQAIHEALREVSR